MAAQALGNIYSNTEISGNARPHLGNVYNYADAADAEQRLLDKLNPVGEASWNSYKNEQRHQSCLAGTRAEILEEITSWANGDRNASCPIFWLAGMAGTGKSTIAMTLAEAFTHTTTIASFFFERGAGDLALCRRLLPTVAYQLATKSSSWREGISAALRKEPFVANLAIRSQLQQLLLQPSRSFSEGQTLPETTIIVVDALDECIDLADIKTLLELLGQQNLTVLGIRILLTSRPEWPIRSAFLEMPAIHHRVLALHEVSRALVDRDIEAFTRSQLERVRSTHKNLPAYWPLEADIRKLVERSAGLFIFAATCCRYVNGPLASSPVRRLAQVCQTSKSGLQGGYLREIDAIYSTVLSSCSSGDCDAEEMASFKATLASVLRTIVIAFDELPISAAAEIAGTDPETLCQMLEALHAVMYITKDGEDIIRLVHESFRDHLLSQDRCIDSSLFVDYKGGHRELGERCLQLLSAQLHENMCGLLPGHLSEDVTQWQIHVSMSSTLRYACLSWTRHLRAGGVLIEDSGPVSVFLRTKGLQYIEAMSLLGKALDILPSLAELDRLMAPMHSIAISALVYDLKTFALSFGREIRTAPLQVYYCAAYYSPRSSLVRNISEGQSALFYSIVDTQLAWDSLPMTIQTTSSVDTLRISQEGGVVASVSDNGVVSIWDTLSGACETTLPSHAAAVTCLEFSPCSSYLATGSSDGNIRIWCTDTWENLLTLAGHEASATTMVFSSDGSTLTSAAMDGCVCIWDLASQSRQMCIRCPDIEAAYQPVFTVNGQYLVVAHSGHAPQVWCFATRRLLHTIEEHPHSTLLLALPTTGPRLASVAEDNILRLWDVATGRCSQTLGGHSDSVQYIVFTPRGNYVGSVSLSEIRIWDVASGLCSRRVDFVFSAALGVRFNDKSRFLGWTSRDVEVWHLLRSESPSVFDQIAKHRWMSSAAFSATGHVVATGSTDGSIHVWHVELNAQSQSSSEVELPSEIWIPAVSLTTGPLPRRVRATCTCLSQDGSIFSWAGKDQFINSWDVKQCHSRQRQPIRFVERESTHSADARLITLSPDGRYITCICKTPPGYRGSPPLPYIYIGQVSLPKLGEEDSFLVGWSGSAAERLAVKTQFAEDCSLATLVALRLGAKCLALVAQRQLIIWWPWNDCSTALRQTVMLPDETAKQINFSSELRTEALLRIRNEAYENTYDVSGRGDIVLHSRIERESSTIPHWDFRVTVHDGWICLGSDAERIVLLPQHFMSSSEVYIAQVGDFALLENDTYDVLVIRVDGNLAIQHIESRISAHPTLETDDFVDDDSETGSELRD